MNDMTSLDTEMIIAVSKALATMVNRADIASGVSHIASTADKTDRV